MNEITFKMELFDHCVRRLRNGNKQSVVFEAAEDRELEKSLIEFRGEKVEATITPEDPSKKADGLQGNYEVFDLSVRRLRNGDKLRVVLECLYDKETEVKLAKIRYDEVNVHLVLVELPFQEDDKEAGDE
jgi:hypothetical protein